MKDNEYKELARKCVNERNFESAIIYYTKLIELNKNKRGYYCDRADCYKELKKYEEAISDWDKWLNGNKIIVIDEDEYETKEFYAEYYYNRAECCIKLGRNEEAMCLYQEALKFVPHDSWYYNACLDGYNDLLNTRKTLPVLHNKSTKGRKLDL